MKVVSIHAAKVRKVQWNGKEVETGIYKELVSGPIEVKKHQMIGDEQADLENHGGEFKAVYSYDHAHYDYWEQSLGTRPQPGMFGENIITQGLDEAKICIGDQLKFGSVLLEATSPRIPCYKLGIRFQNPSIVKRFMNAARSGIYYRVLNEGTIEAGDSIVYHLHHPSKITVAELFQAKQGSVDKSRMKQISKLDCLDPEWAQWLTRS